MTRSPSPPHIDEVCKMDTLEEDAAEENADEAENGSEHNETEVLQDTEDTNENEPDVIQDEQTNLSQEKSQKIEEEIDLDVEPVEPSEHESEDIADVDDLKNETDGNSVNDEENVVEKMDTAESEEKVVEDENENADDKEDSEKGDKEKNDSDDKKDARKRKRSRSASPIAKRSRRPSPAQNIDDFTNDEDEPDIDPKTVLLSWFDSDLNLKVNSSEFYSARPISDGCLGLSWAGVRATHGVNSGKVLYEVQIDERNRIYSLPYEENLYELRCGWSVKSSDLQLGEHPLSYAYGGSGKKSSNNEFTDFGCKFGSRGDVIGVYLDLDSTPCKIEYTVNGESQGVAFEFDKADLNGEALYPHILSKNLAFKVNFGQLENPFVTEVKPKKNERRDSGRRDRRRDRDSKHERDSKHDKSKDEKREKEDNKEKETEKESKDDEEVIKSEVDAVTEESLKPEADNEVPVTDEVIPESGSTEAVEDKTEAVEDKTEAVEDKIEAEDEQIKEPEAVAEKEVAAIEDTKNGDVINNNSDAELKDGKGDEKASTPIEQVIKTLLPDYIFIGKLDEDNLIIGHIRPESRKDCEVILLIGLPSSGKTYWATNHSNENVDKHFQILGLQTLLDKMKVSQFIHSFIFILYKKINYFTDQW